VLAAGSLGALAIATWLLWPAAARVGDASPPAEAAELDATAQQETLAAVEPVAGAAESKSADEPVDVHPDSPGPIATPTSPQEAIDPPPPTPLPEEVRPTARAARRRAPAPDPIVERLSAARIDRELKKVRRRLAACAQEHFPLDKVRVKVSVSVRADGTVSDVSVADPHGRFPLGRCVARTIRSVRFPAAREATKTTRHIVLE
jgi:TonB family protein